MMVCDILYDIGFEPLGSLKRENKFVKSKHIFLKNYDPVFLNEVIMGLGLIGISFSSGLNAIQLFTSVIYGNSY